MDAAGAWKSEDLLFLLEVAGVAAGVSLAVFVGCFCWFRREQRRLQTRLLAALSRSHREGEEVFVTGQGLIPSGELVARFKVNSGRQTVSVVEAEGRRYIHVDGDLSGPARERMIRYLRSEGFMS
jgi:hypothetical protein